MSDRYRRGVEIIEHLAAGRLEQFLTSDVAEVAPDFARMAVEFAFGDLYARDALDLRSREVAAIASLAAIGDAAPQLRNHICAAINLGVTKHEIIEILMQTAIYAGIPTALQALASCHDLLTEGPNSQAACRAAGHG
jgi:4-carboxymuconolactone decarboxylase